jgi:polyhydroxyalkanoate synthesis regulator phasin
MAKMQDVRKTIEASLGNLSTTRAQELAKGMLDRDAAKEQVTKTAADLMEWSQRNRTRLVTIIRTEVRDQLHQMGVATQDDLDALRKRVRDLERAARASGSTKRASAKRSASKSASSKSASATGKGRTASKASPKRSGASGA